MRLSIGDHTQESPSGVVVFLVFLQMRGQFLDPFG